MSQPVPIDDFKWVNIDDKWTAKNITKLDPTSSTSYMFEVDLEIPEAIHDRSLYLASINLMMNNWL